MVLRWREIKKLQIEFACVVRMSEMDLAGHTPVKFTYKENFWNPASLKNLWQHRSQARVPLLICQRSGTVFRPWETTCLVLFAFVRIHPEWSTSIIDWPKIKINFLLSAMLDLPCPSIAYRASDRCLCGIEGEGVFALHDGARRPGRVPYYPDLFGQNANNILGPLDTAWNEVSTQCLAAIQLFRRSISRACFILWWHFVMGAALLVAFDVFDLSFQPLDLQVLTPHMVRLVYAPCSTWSFPQQHLPFEGFLESLNAVRTDSNIVFLQIPDHLVNRSIFFIDMSCDTVSCFFVAYQKSRCAIPAAFSRFRIRLPHLEVS